MARMPARRRIRATFTHVKPGPGSELGELGVTLGFRPLRCRLGVDNIEDYASLGPELCLPAVNGLGKIFRLLKSARISVPEGRDSLLGDLDRACELLERAKGTEVVLELKPRSRIRFTVWTEEGQQTVEDVTEVVESPDAYVVIRKGGRFPLRVPRESVVRQQTEMDRWFEVMDIERSP